MSITIFFSANYGLRKVLLQFFCALLIALGFVSYGSVMQEAHNLPEPWFDDAFMYIRYAENIVAGNGYCWNKEESPLYGCTDILHAYSIVAVKLVFPSLNYEAIAIWLPVINYGLIVLLLTFFLIRFFGENKRQNIFLIGAVVSVALLLNPFLLYHLYTGMDTVLSFSANTILIISFLLLERKKTIAVVILAAVAAWFSWFVRPDNIFYAVLFPSLFLLFRLRKEKKIVATYTVTFVLLIIADLCCKQFVFGEVLPLSFYVKSSEFFTGYMGEADWNPLTYLFAFIGFNYVWLLLLVVFAQRKQAHWYAVFFIPVLLTLIYFFDAVQMMGAAARFYFPSIPFLIFPAVIIAFSAREIPLAITQKIFRACGMVLFFVTIFFFGDVASKKFGQLFLENRKAFLYAEKLKTENLFPVYMEGSYDFYDFCQQLPADTKIAAGEHGRLAAYNRQLHIIDIYGLHNTYFAHHGFSPTYLMQQQPAVIQLAHYNFTKINDEIIRDSIFQNNYDFYPNVFGYGVAVLKKDIRVNEIFRREIETVYGIENPESLTAVLQSNNK